MVHLESRNAAHLHPCTQPCSPIGALLTHFKINLQAQHAKFILVHFEKNRGRLEEIEKIAAMPFTAGSTLFLPFKSGAKVGPISRRLLLVSTCFPLFLLAGEIEHARAIQQDENIHTIRILRNSPSHNTYLLPNFQDTHHSLC